MPVYDIDVQYLIVAQARGIGMSPVGLVERFDDDYQTCTDAGLSPVGVIALVSPRLRLYRRELFDPSKALSISAFLLRHWGSAGEWPIPKRIEVHKTFTVLDRGIVEWLQDMGVTVEEASQPRGFAAFLAEVPRVSMCLYTPRYESSFGNPNSLEHCTANLRRSDRARTEYALHPPDDSDREAWQKLRVERQATGLPSAKAADWDCSQLVDRHRPKVRVEVAVKARDEEVLSVEGIEELVRCMAGGRRRFFDGLSLKMKDFDAWTKGLSHLTDDEFSELYDRANLTLYEFGNDDDGWMYELGGGYLLVPEKSKDLVLLWDTLSSGGDVDRGFEILSPDGLRAEMRFLYLECFSDTATIFLVAPNTKAERALDKGDLLNIQWPVCASPEVWETVKHLINARDRFATPWKVGLGFWSKHREWLESLGGRC